MKAQKSGADPSSGKTLNKLSGQKYQSVDMRGNRKEVVVPMKKTMQERFKEMLKGNLQNLPPTSPSEVRIFLSSTFTDMRTERNCLARDTYPKIKAFCYDHFDLDFQVLDMRWGITDDVTNEHETEKLCLSEIAKCQRVSLGPNFVSILGDRYGTRSLTTEIPAKLFDMLLTETRILGVENMELLEQWYKQDENNKPPIYLLQPIRSGFPHFGDYSNESVAKEARLNWQTTSDKLKQILRKVAESLYTKGQISVEQKHFFFQSVTEIEIQNGILRAENPARHVLCLIRNFDNLTDRALDEDQAERHLDTILMKNKVTIDSEAESLRKQLQNKTLPACLTKANILKYKVSWKARGVDPTQHGDHNKYISNICGDFLSGILKMIHAAKAQMENRISQIDYYTHFDELLQHLHFAEMKCVTFKGREDILDKARSFLLNPKKRSPLVIHAESGVGKTSLMAMIFKMAPNWFGEDCVRIIRFLGTSGSSSDIYSALFDVAGQVADNYGLIMEPVGYKTMKSLVTYLPRFLRNVSRSHKKHVVLLLDSLDQLVANDNAYVLKWLPLELPANIHLVISTLPDTHGILSNAKKLITDSDAFLELQSLPETTGHEIIDSCLIGKNRTITLEQRKVVVDALQKVPSPLFLKLMLDRAIQWKSYTRVDTILVAPSVRDAIGHLFQDLENRFGTVLVSHALGYLTVGLNGLSELELEDALSCDDMVLNEIYQYHSPPVEGVVRLPSLLWARLRHEISEYIVERRSAGKTTLYWYHRQFVEAANEIYVNRAKGTQLHKNLASLFLSENGIKRTIILKNRGLTIVDADRQITSQPLAHKNKRKLMALPYHLQRCGDLELLKDCALCNLTFLMTKIRGCGVPDVIRDYDDVLLQKPDDIELCMLKTCFLEVRGSLKRAKLLPVELLSRLHVSKELMPYLAALLSQATAFLQQSPEATFLPVYPCLAKYDASVALETPDNHLINSQSIRSVAFTADSQYLVTTNHQQSLNFWCSKTGIKVKTMNIPPSEGVEWKPDDFMFLEKFSTAVSINRNESQLQICSLTCENTLIQNHGSTWDGKIAVVTKVPNSSKMYFATCANKKIKIYLYDTATYSTENTFPVKDSYPLIEGVEMMLTESGKYLILKIPCTDTELDIILKAEKKSNLTRSNGIFKFAALDLNKYTGKLIICHRVLTQIPCLGNCYESGGLNTVLIGRNRGIIVWDPDTGYCDQKMLKGTKLPFYFRPIWIENDATYMKRCHGRTLCMASNPGGKVTAVGSEDGWLMVYDRQNGLNVAGYIEDKPNHGGPVQFVAVAPDNRWVASISEDKILKVWSVYEKLKEIFCVRLSVAVIQMMFSPDSQLLAILGSTDHDTSQLLLFQLAGKVPPDGDFKLISDKGRYSLGFTSKS